MGPPCPICLDPLAEGQSSHPACLVRLFGVPAAPALVLRGEDVPEKAREAVGKISIPGVQPKVSLALSADRTSLEVVGAGGHYLLKPQVDGYRAAPENEHLTMHLACRCGIPAPAFGNFALLRAEGGPYRLSPAYDLLCTFLYGDDTMALPMRDGTTGEPKDKDLTGKDFLAFARACDLSPQEAGASLNELLAQLAGSEELVRRSLLPQDMKERYLRLLTKRSRALRQGLA